jgi:O-antigen/teichoic acid export membrane protein
MDVIPASPSLTARFWQLVNRRATWVLVDQGVVSAGTFISITVILARKLSQGDYGSFNIFFDTMMYLNSLQAALVVYPLTLQGASSDRSNLGRLATASLALSVGLLPILGIAIAISQVLQSAPRWQDILLAVATMFLWQIQETLRRAIIADLRLSDVLWGDAVKYLGQAAVLAVLAWRHWLDFRTALVVMIVTSIAAIVIQALQVGLARIRIWQLRLVARDFWRLGRWMLVTNFSAALTSLAYPWMLGWWHGNATAGAYYAVTNTFKLANPVMSSMTGLIVPAVARATANEGAAAGKRIALRYTAFGALLLMPYFLFLVVMPTLMLKLFYGTASPYTKTPELLHHNGNLLRLFVANYTAVYLLSTFGGWLSALGRSRWLFYSQVVNMIVSVCVGMPLIYYFGVGGLIVGGMFAAFSTTAVVVYYIYKAAYRKTAPPQPAPL